MNEDKMSKEEFVEVNEAFFELLGKMKESVHLMVEDNRDGFIGAIYVNGEMYEFDFTVNKVTE